MKRALVLSGGGAKGAYQIGVWKALREKKIDISIVTGTSVGALNGALIVQNDYRKAKRLWKHMDFEVVFDKETLERYHNCKTTLDMVEMFGHGFIKDGGMKPNNLERQVERFYNSRKFFSSECDFGISTFNVSDLKGIKITKSEMDRDLVPDYIMASATCFPAFQMKKIGNKKYIDGGVFDNLPINLAVELGADEIIAVDLNAPGIKEKVKNKNIPITYIEPSNDIGGFLNFNQKNAKLAMRYGYLDTLKALHYLDGENFSFNKKVIPKSVEKIYPRLDSVIKYVFDFDEDQKSLKEVLTKEIFKKLNAIKNDNNLELIQDVIEELGTCFNLSNQKVYNFFGFHLLLWKNFKETEVLSEVYLKKILKDKKLAKFLNRGAIVKYFYQQIGSCYMDSSIKKRLSRVALIFPKEALGAFYLYALKKEMWWIW